ncbi:MAG TPA: aspartate--tRNA(Asn) ligase [Thermomicrobiales bacterium]|nr:aspartate--tRNA(Asn) ligase [Thermomicrobiales bacterium]
MQIAELRSGLTPPRIPTRALPEHAGETVRLAGWLHRFRQLGKISFLILRDHTGMAQVVLTEPEQIEQVAALGHESVVEVVGNAVAVPQAPGGVEIHAPAIEVIAAVNEQLPFDLYRPEIAAQLPTVLDHAAVANRHPSRRIYFQLAAALVAGFRTTLDELGFTEIFSPKLVGSATESGANVFALDYFESRAYLAQSPQFYKQMMVGVFERVYEVGPVFRAEPHDTARHLNEYVSLDAEMGFITDQRDVMRVLNQVIAGMVDAAAAKLEAAGAGDEFAIPEVPVEIPILHFADAMELLGKGDSEELDLAPADERDLCDWAEREHGSEWLFIEGYPMAKRPFYTHPDPQRPEYSRGFDLLFRGLELVTGGQRRHLYPDYLAALEAAGLSAEGMEGYLEAFKYGMPPHGGFAIGLERFVARLTGVQNVREVTLFPRTMTRLVP